MTNLRFELPDLVWADDLASEPEPDHFWVVPNLFERGDRCIVTGGEGEGKSTLLRQWGIMVASGIHPLTLESIPRQRVLLLDLENSREQIKDEINKICDSAGIDVPTQPWLRVAPWPAGMNLASSEYEAALTRKFEDARPDFVVGGPLYKMVDLSLADENTSKALASALDRLRDQFHFAFIAEAHQVNESTAYNTSTKAFVRNRPTRPFGSSLWRRWPEYGFCLFTDGTIAHWRMGRRLRDWPHKLTRGDVWLWENDRGLCAACGGPKPPEKQTYCSDRCKNNAKVKRHRAKGGTLLTTDVLA